MDAWNAKVPIWYKVCGRIWKTVQYLSIVALIEVVAMMIFLLA